MAEQYDRLLGGKPPKSCRLRSAILESCSSLPSPAELEEPSVAKVLSGDPILEKHSRHLRRGLFHAEHLGNLRARLQRETVNEPSTKITCDTSEDLNNQPNPRVTKGKRSCRSRTTDAQRCRNISNQLAVPGRAPTKSNLKRVSIKCPRSLKAKEVHLGRAKQHLSQHEDLRKRVTTGEQKDNSVYASLMPSILPGENAGETLTPQPIAKYSDADHVERSCIKNWGMMLRGQPALC